jgi:hypothetical protein
LGEVDIASRKNALAAVQAENLPQKRDNCFLGSRLPLLGHKLAIFLYDFGGFGCNNP